MIRGRIIYADARQLWLARGTSLKVSHDSGRTWQPGGEIELGLRGRLAASTRLGRRLARAGIHHLLPGKPAVAIVNSGIYQRRAAGAGFARVGAVVGSRPLALASDGDLVCYGEYRSNTERDTVRVWGAAAGSTEWRPVYAFTGIRHIHGVFFDPYAGSFWITTGDDDHESGLWVTEDRFATVERVAGGSQQLRAVQLLFTDRYVYYGSDTPLAENFLYRMERMSGRIERLQAVGSSVFFGCKVGDALFFSTAVEPSAVNQTEEAQVWCSLDGERWSLLRTFDKDRWSLRYLQYGQVMFPAGPGDGKNLYFTPFATRFDQRTFTLPLRDIGEAAAGPGAKSRSTGRP